MAPITQPLKGKKPTQQRPSAPKKDNAPARPTKIGEPASTVKPESSAPEVDPEAEERKKRESDRRANAIAILSGVMGQYGLSSLMAKITEWVQDGYEAEAIMGLIRSTPEYKDRFPAMAALAAKGRALSESEYIAYEANAAALERLYGMPTGMLTSKDQITNLLTKEVSARELEERTVKASASQYQLPEEYRRTFRDYYGIDSGGLTAYYLDPDVAAPLLEKRFVSAQIGAEAALRSLSGVGADISEALYQRGVDREQAARGFGQVAQMGEFTVGKGETATQNNLIGAAFDTDPLSIDKVQRVADTRKKRFEAGGGFAGGDSGVSGLGGASTS